MKLNEIEEEEEHKKKSKKAPIELQAIKSNSIVPLANIPEIIQEKSIYESKSLYESQFDLEEVITHQNDDIEIDYEVLPIDTGCIQYYCYKLISHQYFIIFSMSMIFLNTIVLASEHYQQSTSWTNVLELSNLIFTLYFTIEVIIVYIGQGYNYFFKDGYNIFDLIIVFLSLIELLLEELNVINGAGLSVLRSFRLLRVFKLADSWSTLRRIIQVINDTVSSLAYFTLLLLLFHFIIALIGVQLFKDKMVDDVTTGSIARANYEHLGWAIITTFQIISGENWNEVMYTAIQ